MGEKRQLDGRHIVLMIRTSREYGATSTNTNSYPLSHAWSREILPQPNFDQYITGSCRSKKSAYLGGIIFPPRYPLFLTMFIFFSTQAPVNILASREGGYKIRELV